MTPDELRQRKYGYIKMGLLNDIVKVMNDLKVKSQQLYNNFDENKFEDRHNCTKTLTKIKQHVHDIEILLQESDNID